MEQETSLKIVESSDQTTSIVIGKLTATEEKAIDDVAKTRLGVGVWRNPSEQKSSVSTGSGQDLPRVEHELSTQPS